MPSLQKHQSGQFTKLLLMGDSSTGKTGGLVSLVKADYKLRILDFDNGLDPLVKQIKRVCPDKLGNVEFRTLRDKVKSSPVGPVIDGQPKAFVEALKMLDNWRYTHDGEAIDLGKPEAWGESTILVIDSLTFMAYAALDWSKVFSGSKDGRMQYFHAQEAIESVLGLIQAESFRTNVIVISHVTWIDRQDGTTKGYPSAIGKALSPSIPTYFNSVALAMSKVSGSEAKRTIQTAPTAMIDLKNPAPFAMQPSLPLETGLADFFRAVRS